ncbi:serine/threonine protein kinase [Chiayiivirga flava]|uniref:non-specific serine/threonine protein kinase n=1 Tax=Chiayiivirga flava TaxID=659595 RepID=A0A7W8D8M9_9GAMM|nr:serine/threonine-protein kinase [Chiayiivirga flava]MBB5208815.1 tRNA A-37 threonylcarbamoyl transferase component Bud32 [Chiayiivirga flava]
MTQPSIQIPGYEFVRELGVGGMATVYLATQTSLERRVAIKVMRRAGVDDNFEKRFLMEGRTMAKLPHRNIVGVYDIVQNDAINYIAMEYLGGGTLGDKLQDGLSLAEAISVVVQIAGALQFAHDNGVVHRDLKPANILFRDRHTPVLTDFGIARQRDAQATRLTQTGMMIGTPTYMSPEQAMGGDVDGRSDQYSLGVMFYEMLTGSVPFGGETPLNVVLAHINTPPPPLPPQFVHFQPTIDRMLAKEPAHRYDDLHVFVRELKAQLTGSETMLARLQIDPNQTASQQLRLLGFSESQINTGSADASHVRRAATSDGARAAARASGPGVRMDAPTRKRARPQRPAWLLPAAAALVLLLVGAGLWFVLGGRDELDPTMRRLANNTLKQVDLLVEQGKLIAPAGDNAFEELQTLQSATGAMPEIDERLQRIVDTLQAQAEQALANGNFAAAETRIGEALAVRPDDARLASLRQRIETGKLAAVRDARVAELLTQAQTARAAGRVLGDGGDNALALVRQAMEVDAQSAPARTLLDAIAADALAPARTALAAGKLDDAARQLRSVASDLSSEAAWQTLDAELAAALAREEQRSRIAGFVSQVRNQIAAGNYAEPAGDNALESLARLAELDAANADAATLRGTVAAALAKQAQAAAGDGDIATALARYDQALLAQPDPAITAARNALAQRLDQRQAQIAQGLNEARAAINARRYVAPAGSSARDALLRVRSLDAGNAEATRLLAGLPSLVRDAAQELAKEARYDDALALLREAAGAWPDDGALAVATRQIQAERDRGERAASRAARLAELQELLARRQLNADSARAIGSALTALQTLDPADAEARALRERFLRGIGTVIDAAKTPADLAPLPPVLEQLQQQLGASSADIVALQASFVAARTRLQAAEDARIAASSGTLVLNATPWANVESVVDQGTGKALALPDDRSTPLRLVAPAGTYRVSFRHPDVAQPVAVVATLDARKTQATSAAFRTLTAADYLKRAGYAQ